jgi:CRP-like cAMP-binding protein
MTAAASLPPELGALQRAGIFNSLPFEDLTDLARGCRRRQFSAGTAFIREGEIGDEMYVIDRGRVRVERSEGLGGKRSIVLAELGPGEVVGEMGVLDREPRSATVRAVTDIEVLELTAAWLDKVIERHPHVKEALLHVISGRLRNVNVLAGRVLADVWHKVTEFRPLSEDALRYLTAQGHSRHFAVGEVLMREGGPSKSLHVIARGRVRVERSRGKEQAPVLLATLGTGEVVGEMGVLDGGQHSATVVAMSDVETVELDAITVAQAIIRFPDAGAALLHVLTRRLRHADELLARTAAVSA